MPKSYDSNALLVEIARNYWNRAGEPNYQADALESYVLLALLEGHDAEASRAMARMGPAGGKGNRYGLFLQVGLILAHHRYADRLSQVAKDRVQDGKLTLSENGAFKQRWNG